jgi:hypothetical protein
VERLKCLAFECLIGAVVRVTLPNHRQVYQVRRGSNRSNIIDPVSTWSDRD